MAFSVSGGVGRKWADLGARGSGAKKPDIPHVQLHQGVRLIQVVLMGQGDHVHQMIQMGLVCQARPEQINPS